MTAWEGVRLGLLIVSLESYADILKEIGKDCFSKIEFCMKDGQIIIFEPQEE